MFFTIKFSKLFKTCVIGVHTLPAVTSLVTRYSETDRTQYTMKAFGILYLYKNQILSVKVQYTLKVLMV